MYFTANSKYLNFFDKRILSLRVLDLNPENSTVLGNYKYSSESLDTFYIDDYNDGAIGKAVIIKELKPEPKKMIIISKYNEINAGILKKFIKFYLQKKMDMQNKVIDIYPNRMTVEDNEVIILNKSCPIYFKISKGPKIE